MIGDGTCPVTGCPDPAKDGQLLCRRHWSIVPGPLKRDVNRAWSRWRDGNGVLADLRAAQNAAITAVSP